MPSEIVCALNPLPLFTLSLDWYKRLTFASQVTLTFTNTLHVLLYNHGLEMERRTSSSPAQELKTSLSCLWTAIRTITTKRHVFYTKSAWTSGFESVNEGSLPNHLVDDQSSKADHSETPVPALRSGIEGTPASSISRFSIHNWDHGGISKNLNCSNEED